MWSLDDIVKATGGRPVQIGERSFPAISTDSRTVEAKELFIPLHGPNFEGHRFLGDAMKRSAGGCLCEASKAEFCTGLKGTVILVDDSLKALTRLAAFRRNLFTGTVVGITGSNGKTTTKEILADMVKDDVTCAYNEKNFNNIIGVSKSIIAFETTKECYILEVGTNSPGEIRMLTELIRPHIALITNVNPSHLEGLGDVEGVLDEKLDLFRFTMTGGTIIVNADDPALGPAVTGDPDRKVLRYGIREEADFRLSVVNELGWEGYELSLALPNGTVRAKTPLLGIHNLYNILAAASIAATLGIPAPSIRRSIERFQSFSMRFRPLTSSKGYVIIDDAYNANPASMEMAINAFSRLPVKGRKIAVIGDMRELGDKTLFYHRELGTWLKQSTIDEILLCGEYVAEALNEAKDVRIRFFADKKGLVSHLKKTVSPGDAILVKASRAGKMEDIVEAML